MLSISTGSLHDVYSSKDDYSSSQHVKSSPYSQPLRDVSRHSTSSSSYSTNSTLLTTTSHQPTSTKVFTKPFAPKSSSDIQLGMEVLVTRSRGQIGRGKVKYVGPLPGRQDIYIGIELGPGQGKFSSRPNLPAIYSESRLCSSVSRVSDPFAAGRGSTPVRGFGFFLSSTFLAVYLSDLMTRLKFNIFLPLS